MSQPMVSVICTVYNHAAYLRDCLEGFVKQKTIFPFEVLVHDDASTDGSTDIIREYEEKYPHIIKPIYQTENQYSKRIPIAKTFIKPRVTGKYVAFCEGDDYWTDPDKLQKQCDFMENNLDYSMCVCSSDWLDMRTNTVVNKCKVAQDRDISIDEIILEDKGRIFQFGGILMKSEIYMDSPAWRYEFGVGDTPLAMSAATCGKVRMTADVMSVYRNHAPGSWTSRVTIKKDYKVNQFQKMIAGFTAFNEATNYAYDKAVSLRIKRLKYFIAGAKGDLKALLSPELREVFKARSLPARVMDVIGCKAPKLREFIRKKLKK